MTPVSICLATYNRAPLLRKTLESIFSQNYEDLEVVVVDDGSQDDTKELAKEFPIVYIYLDRPYYCNQSRAMNVAIKNATHDIVIMQSAEAVHQGGVISKLVEAVEQYPNTWCFARVVNLVDGKEENDYTSSKVPRPYFFLCSLWKKNLLEIRGLDEDYNLPGYDDNDLADRLIKGMGLVTVFRDDILGYHYDHERPKELFQENNMSRVYESKTRMWKDGEINHIRNKDREWGVI